MASFYQLLLEAMRQNSQPGMAPDDPAEIARRYPQYGVSDSSYAGAQSHPSPSGSNLPARDPNFRQLVRVPSAAGQQASDGSVTRSDLPDNIWSTPPQNAEPAGANGTKLPWWAPPLPVFASRRFSLNPGGLGRPIPPPYPSGPSNIPLPEAWKMFGAGLMLLPEYLRESLIGQRGDYSDNTGAAYQKVTPGLAEEDDSGCMEERELARKECKEARAHGWQGEYGGEAFRNPRAETWSVDDCVRGRVSERCGGNPYDRPDGKPKKKRYRLSASSTDYPMG